MTEHIIVCKFYGIVEKVSYTIDPAYVFYDIRFLGNDNCYHNYNDQDYPELAIQSAKEGDGVIMIQTIKITSSPISYVARAKEDILMTVDLEFEIVEPETLNKFDVLDIE